jgi:hypothetical protein
MICKNNDEKNRMESRIKELEFTIEKLILSPLNTNNSFKKKIKVK